MKISTSKKRITLSSILLVILLGLVILNYKAYIAYEAFNYISFIITILLSILSCILFAIKIDFKDRTGMIFTMFSFMLSIFVSYIIIELLNQNALFSIYTKRLIFNFIIIIFLHLFIYAISNRISITIVIANSILFILGIVNYTVTCFRGTPLVPWDVLSLKTAAYVASSYTFEFGYHLLLSTSLFIFIISVALKAKYIFKSKKINLAIRFISLIIILIFTMLFYKTDVIDYFDFENNLWRPTDEYLNNGFLASFVKQSKNLFNDEPDNYSPDNVENILLELEDIVYKNDAVSVLSTGTSVENNSPNIVVIMSESFSDLTVNRRLQCNRRIHVIF